MVTDGDGGGGVGGLGALFPHWRLIVPEIN